MSHTSASLFTGGAIFETGAMMAGLKPVWGVEIRPDIADVAERNIPGLVVVRSDVATVDYSTLPKVYHLHASPVCKNASQANNGGEEAQEDISSAQAICRAVEQVGPVAFTLENVWQYRQFDSFKMIVQRLRELGYCVDWWHLNAADYAVPQTRKRLILIAHLERQPRKPQPTHSRTPDLFGLYRPWVGWYEAIADLIDDLPDSEFAPWQLERLPAELKTSLLSIGISRDHKGNEYENCQRSPNEPAYTVTANSNQTGIRAYLAPVNGEGSNGFCGDEPAQTIAANHSADKYRAFIIPGDNTGNGVIRQAGEPMSTIQTRTPGQCPHRAAVAGRIVKMTPRALARFMSIPDTYVLPDAQGLACEIIGNGVCSLTAKAICEAAAGASLPGRGR